ncbi:MAG: hypothetical protein ACP5JH_02915 [Bacteroidota bacterium]
MDRATAIFSERLICSGGEFDHTLSCHWGSPNQSDCVVVAPAAPLLAMTFSDAAIGKSRRWRGRPQRHLLLLRLRSIARDRMSSLYRACPERAEGLRMTFLPSVIANPPKAAEVGVSRIEGSITLSLSKRDIASSSPRRKDYAVISCPTINITSPPGPDPPKADFLVAPAAPLLAMTLPAFRR